VDFPVLGTDNLGNSKMMTPGNDYKFPGDMVFELPMAKDGLSLDPPPEKKEMVNLHDFLITEKDLEFLNSERCFRGNCLENTRKAFDATAGSIWGVPYTANVWGKDDLNITSIRNTPTKQQVEDFPWMEGDRGMGTADSWDIQGNIVRAGGKTLYNRNVEGSTFQPGQYPIGSIYSFGPAGTDETDKEERQKGFSVRKGLQPSHHSVMSVGVNEKGEIILYDAHLKKYDTEENIIKQLAKELWAGGLNYELEAVGVPESYAELTPGNIEQSDNFYRPRYFTEYQFDVDRLDEIRQDPKFRIKEDNEFRAPRLDKGAMREFTQSLKDNKETMMQALRLTSDEYDDLANLSIALAMAESEGGGGLSVDWAGSTQGLTQLNFDNIKDDEALSRQLAMFNESVRGPQKIKQLADLRDPAKSAIATLIYTNAGRRRSSKLHEEGLEPGVRNFYDNTGLKDLVRSSSSRINRSGVYLDELNDRVNFSDIPGWNEKDVKKITTSLNALTGTNRYQADIDDDGDVYIKMKTLGNDPNMSDAMKVAYWWQSPTSLKTGDAQGGNVHAKRIEGYYKAISEKTPEVSSDNLMASNTEIPEMQVGGSLPKAQPGREFFSNDATRVDMPMLTPEMLAQARGVDEPMYSTDVSKGRPYPMPAEEYATAYESPSTARKVLNRAANPMTTLGYVVRGQDIPDRVPDKGNPIDIAAEVVNPAAWADYAVMSGEALGRGDYVGAGLNALASIPAIPSTVKGAPEVLRSTVDLVHPVGVNLRRIKKEGIQKGFSPRQIKEQQMREVGITSEQRKGYFPGVSELATEYYVPYGYHDFFSKLAQVPRKILKGEKNSNILRDTEYPVLNSEKRLDAWKLYSGMPQKSNTFKIAETFPVNHPSYSNRQLANVERFSLNNDQLLSPDYKFTSGRDIDDLLKAPDKHIPALRKIYKTFKGRDKAKYFEDLKSPSGKIFTDRDVALGVMGGYNQRFFNDIMEYNDIWDLHPGGFPVENFFGKPFLSHGQIPFNPSSRLKDYESLFSSLKDFERMQGMGNSRVRLPREPLPEYTPVPRSGLRDPNAAPPPSPPPPPVTRRKLGGDIVFAEQAPKAQEGKEIYKVKSGDTFLGIANRLEIPREDFIEANPDINIDKLSLGQKLNIPVKKPYVPTNDVIPSEMLWRQAFAESNWETDVENKGGYKGLGQIGDDVITDYKKAFKVKEVDPFDPVQNSTIHKWYMNKLYNSEWVNKPNQDPNVRLAKALVAYNWGPKTARKWFTDKKKAGVDIYNSFDWLEDLPSEPKGYIDMIIFNKNTPTRKYVEDLAEAMTDTTLTNQITNLYKRAGGEMNKLEMYKGYINGEFDGTDLEPKAQRVYDRMNRVYYAPAKKAGMSPPNFIMTNIIPRQLQTVL